MDAQLACPGCGAGVAIDGSSCPYCGTEYAAKNYGYCANCGGSQWAGPDGLSCPGCGQPLAGLASAAYATAGTGPNIAAPLGGAAPIPVTAEAPAPAAQADRSKARTRTTIILVSVGLFVVGFIGIMMTSSVLRADSLVAVLALAATCLLIAAFAPRADGRSGPGRVVDHERQRELELHEDEDRSLFGAHQESQEADQGVGRAA